MLNRSSLLAAFALSAMAASGFAGPQPAIPTPQAIVSKKQRRALFSGQVYASFKHSYPKAAGITMAQQKRAARKTKNVRRHKLAAKCARG